MWGRVRMKKIHLVEGLRSAPRQPSDARSREESRGGGRGASPTTCLEVKYLGRLINFFSNLGNLGISLRLSRTRGLSMFLLRTLVAVTTIPYNLVQCESVLLRNRN